MDQSNSRCPDCGDEAHAPGQSYRSNCGESERIYRDTHALRSSDLDGANAYVAGAYYDRKGQPRKELRKRIYTGGINGRND